MRFDKIKNRRTVMSLVVVVAVAIILFIVEQQGYSNMKIGTTYKIGNTANSNYKEFGNGIVKYSRDGVAFFNQHGDEMWNQSYQMKNPFIEANAVSMAVADQGGNDIFVFQKEGMKGEVHTSLPIEKIAVSEQGIVAVILKNEGNPKIQCFDLAGNLLVEHKTTLDSKGYPISVSLSTNGETLQVVYVQVKDMMLSSRVVYYNFGKQGEGKTDHQILEKEYEDGLVATGFFMDDDSSSVVGEQGIQFYKGKEKPKAGENITVKEEIQSVFYDQKHVGIIIKCDGGEGYEMRLYNESGKQVFSEGVSGLYGNIRISGRKIIMYDGRKCCVYSLGGRKIFEGELENTIYEIMPILGFHKYAIVNTNGIQIGRLAK